MTSAAQFSEENAISESQQLGRDGSFLINALKMITARTTALKQSHRKENKEDLVSFLSLFLLTYTKCKRKNSAGIHRTNSSKIKTNVAPCKLFLVKSLET